MILPYLTYCNLVWGNSNSTDINQLFLLQKKMIRIITNSAYLAHTNALFGQLRLLKIFDIYTVQATTFMHKITYNVLPAHSTSLFNRCSNTHGHHTRASINNFFIEPRRTTLRSRTIRFSGPKLWNSLPNEIKEIRSLSRFKSIIINHILYSYIHNLDPSITTVYLSSSKHISH